MTPSSVSYLSDWHESFLSEADVLVWSHVMSWELTTEETLTAPECKGKFGVISFEKTHSWNISDRSSNSVLLQPRLCPCWSVHSTPTTAGFFMLPTNKQTKSDKSSLTCRHLKYKLTVSLVSTYVSSRCCSRVDSIINDRKQPQNVSFVEEVLFCCLLPQSFRVQSADCHVNEGCLWGQTTRKAAKLQQPPKLTAKVL